MATLPKQVVGAQGPWPCSSCGAPGVKNLGTRGYCTPHLAVLYREISSETWLWAGGGIGLPEAPRPEFGEGFHGLRCVACGATWTGPAFERCWWCVRGLELMRQGQARRVLTPPEVNPDDLAYERRMGAWGDRLARAVDAGLVTRDRALAAWRRAARRDATEVNRAAA